MDQKHFCSFNCQVHQGAYFLCSFFALFFLIQTLPVFFEAFRFRVLWFSIYNSLIFSTSILIKDSAFKLISILFIFEVPAVFVYKELIFNEFSFSFIPTFLKIKAQFIRVLLKVIYLIKNQFDSKIFFFR